MIALIDQVRLLFKKALHTAFDADFNGIEPDIVTSSNPSFGDYQTNMALLLSRKLKQPPRAIAEIIIKHTDLGDLCDPLEVAGRVFINLRVKKSYIENQLNKLTLDERLGINRADNPERIIVEYSSINMAKEMHVGHLRGTIIGDCLANVYEFLGHDVLRISHTGDWGTQFGMLIAYLKEVCPQALSTPNAVNLGDLVAFYKKAKAHFDEDAAFQDTARQEVVLLQSENPDSIKAWQILCDQSRKEANAIYAQLEVSGLIERGESLYNSMLPQIVQELEQLGLAVVDQGAKCVFVEGFTNEQGQPMPLIIQKKDGGYNYATTDLAALRSRIINDKVDRILHVVDAGQSDHFAQFLQVARKAGWIPDNVEVTHIPYGVVQGADGKKLKTRSGEIIRLQELLNEAIVRTRAELESRLSKDQREETEEFKDDIAKVIGIGAIKYADLSLNRMTNYIFDYDKMLALQGNTAPYMIYAYVRVRGIGRKADVDFNKLAACAKISLKEECEYELGKQLLRFDEVIAAVAEERLPNRICDYLFELCQKFNQFYESCPVLNAQGDLRDSRLLLCDLTARTIKLRLSLLGIRAPERM